MGISVEGKNYEEVYSGAFNEGMSLEYLFQKFNIDRPPDFAGHSLSVSDVIVLEKPGTREAYFVDNLGFESIPDFFKGLSEPDRKEKPMDPARPLAVIESKQMSAVSRISEAGGEGGGWRVMVPRRQRLPGLLWRPRKNCRNVGFKPFDLGGRSKRTTRNLVHINYPNRRENDCIYLLISLSFLIKLTLEENGHGG